MCLLYGGGALGFQGVFWPANSGVNHCPSFPFAAMISQGFSFVLKNCTWWNVSLPYSCSHNILYHVYCCLFCILVYFLKNGFHITDLIPVLVLKDHKQIYFYVIFF